ncbi:glycosyl hydrolase family 17 protein [Algoriphagus hitonicola]|uniref:Endo-1,3-beta-glucanase btgC n=1 Tax=Algoriphagus hitonicola TaxID=435880 RepID=A0A1I2RJ91_9BACT|nr:glycosyl hydrolase family 17 protein [Algoriphagus hitonicola]SFG38697.1 Exo-beta-1,3-glucanase, GH17 family [Algoriphagus hitonicola]
MKSIFKSALVGVALMASFSCSEKSTEVQTEKSKQVTAKEILGNPAYLAISFEGYRERSRDIQPSVDQLKDDLKILSAMGIRIVRTYNVQLAHAATLLKAIQELMNEDENFEMYVMLGAWIDCKNAWTDLEPDHEVESEQNAGEIDRAVALANKYPEIVRILAVGNEAMVRWATSYFVQPAVILKWVNHLQALKAAGDLPKDLWITSSDDFSSWGGGDPSYHTEDLKKLAQAVDYVSIHTYPYHNSHYNPDFWRVPIEESKLSTLEKVDKAMLRARDFAKSQYDSVANYMKSIGVDKPIHIGETGWASVSDGFYGPEGSRAADEYKQALYYQHMREWTNEAGISLFYFEAFNEQWKDAGNPIGSENHFGLFGLKGEAKYALWDLVDQGIFKDLTRDGNPIVKTYGGNMESLLKDVLVPPAK